MTERADTIGTPDFCVQLTPQQRRDLPCEVVEVAEAIRQGRAAQSGTPARGFLTIVKDANSELRPLELLRDLPPGVRQMIMENQAVAIAELFKIWAESIADIARMNLEAHWRYLRQKEERPRSESLTQRVPHASG